MDKNYLLAFNCFDDNQYLDMYLDLINSNLNTKPIPNFTECHHIIPKLYFKLNKQKIDNSKENLVNLEYPYHVLAHCLLALSFNSPRLTSGSIDACFAILNSTFNKKYKSLENFVEEFNQVKDVLKCNHFISDEQKIKISQRSSLCSWYNDGKRETFVPKKPSGDKWVKGRLPFSENQKKKISKASSACKWYNNGKEEKFSPSRPEGFIYNGRINMSGDKNVSCRPEVKEKLKGKNAKRVRCIDTGETYNSISEAKEKTGCPTVGEVCRGLYTSSLGYHFEYI